MHPEHLFINTEHATQLHALPLFEQEQIEQYLALLTPEFFSTGGNIRDITMERLITMSREGHVWGVIQNDVLLCGLTLELMEGHSGHWLYLNHGVTHPGMRGKGLAEQLIHAVVSSRDPATNYFVLTVTRGPFIRNGFLEVTVPELEFVDVEIARVVGNKLRPEHPAHICIRKEVKP